MVSTGLLSQSQEKEASRSTTIEGWSARLVILVDVLVLEY